MHEKFEHIIKYLVSWNREQGPLSRIEINDQFRPDDRSSAGTLRNLNAAFLIELSGETHPLYKRAKRFIRELEQDTAWKKTAGFYRMGASLIRHEIAEKCAEDKRFRGDLEGLHDWTRGRLSEPDPVEAANRFWKLFFPEGVLLFEDKRRCIESLRKEREIRVTRLNPDPVRDPLREILFTSNILLTLNSPSKPIENLDLSSGLIGKLKKAANERQLYWYDHPVQIGVETDKNEALYGIRGLDRAVEYEKAYGTTGRKGKIPCVLSVSVTHPGLKEMARVYLEEVFRKAGGVRHLNIYVFSESDVARIVRDIIIPAADRYLDGRAADRYGEFIGVDGEYGRHYSFLKAVSAFWQVFVDPGIRGTFKIDLDQVFPQKEIVGAFGHTAFDHFKTPLWGAKGRDAEGKSVELGMIAGALVNREDIGRSLFTPDIKVPGGDLKGDELVFFSPLPQAVSTQAEMMTRYGEGAPDGRTRCIQRVHVTGGTNGILVSSLRKHRPFTPGFIGRAEDQAYLFSVLFQEPEGNLRYVHKDGLIMRHDKESFADESVRAASSGKLIGDYVRILLFSFYAKGLPWPVERIKQAVDPFTGCFVSHVPFTIVYLRMALKGASLFEEGREREGVELLEMGVERLSGLIKKLSAGPDSLGRIYLEEKEVWDDFYDVLDKVEEDMARNDPFALDLAERARKLVEDCRIDVSPDVT